MRVESPAPEPVTCPDCGAPAGYVRTREFYTEDARVWECLTLGCRRYNHIWHTSLPVPMARDHTGT